MPFSTMTLLNDSMTVTLDGTGTALLDPYGVRWCDLTDAQYMRVHAEILVNTVGASASVYAYAVLYDSTGSAWAAFGTTNTATVTNANGTTLTIGYWWPVSALILAAGDMQFHVRVTGTASASVTVNFCDIQFR